MALTTHDGAGMEHVCMLLLRVLMWNVQPAMHLTFPRVCARSAATWQATLMGQTWMRRKRRKSLISVMTKQRQHTGVLCTQRTGVWTGAQGSGGLHLRSSKAEAASVHVYLDLEGFDEQLETNGSTRSALYGCNDTRLSQSRSHLPSKDRLGAGQL
eukprot:scaffold299375_cov22-Tisochrysis_lutea.AAC.4